MRVCARLVPVPWGRSVRSGRDIRRFRGISVFEEPLFTFQYDGVIDAEDYCVVYGTLGCEHGRYKPFSTSVVKNLFTIAQRPSISGVGTDETARECGQHLG